jgi:polysaccharide export outer membrane protein
MTHFALRTTLALLMAGLLSACTSLGSSGPSSRDVANVSGRKGDPQILIRDLDSTVLQAQTALVHGRSFADVFGDVRGGDTAVGKGDLLEITIWEAPPAVLFGGATASENRPATMGAARGSTIPDQLVDDNGQISIPFIGQLNVLGLTPVDIQREIVRRLKGEAHQPQAIVRIVTNANSNVTVIGEVGSSGRIPLTSKGERVLDVLAAAGGVKQPVDKTTIRIARGATTALLPLEKILSDPRQNISMQSNDVVTAMFQPYSFTALGAIGRNAEVPFEGTGLTLSQALGRIGGLRDDRADVRGVFIFRFEDSEVAMGSGRDSGPMVKIPVIYRVNMKDPASFFLAQTFPIRDKDLIYVSNAPLADLQRFVTLVSSVAFSSVGVADLIP